MDQLNVNDLIVVEFKSKHINPNVSDWVQNAKVPFAQSCTRQISKGA